MSIELRFRKARSLRSSGDLGEAKAILERIVAEYPANGRARQALDGLNEALLARNDPPAEDQTSLTEALARGEDDVVLHSTRELLARYPQSCFLWNVMGRACLRLEQAEVAEVCFNKVLSLDPGSAPALVELGRARLALGRTTSAIACYSMALERDPGCLAALNNMGNAYTALRSYDLAADHLGRAAKLAPENPQIASNYASALLNSGCIEAADEYLTQACKRWLDDPALHYSLGRAKLEGKFLSDASAAFERSAQLDPANDTAMSETLKVREAMNDWRDWDRSQQLAFELGRNQPQNSPGVKITRTDDPIAQRAEAERHARAVFEAAPAPLPPARTARPDRLRIGYFSSDYENHATMILMGGLFEKHDRERFEIFAYSYGRPSAAAARQRLLGNVDAFRDIRATPDADVVALARADGLDIAVDLKGYTRDGRSAIFAHRLAPVQIAYLGWPGTMGHEAFDYAVVDRTVVPERFRDGFSERLIYMPHSYQVNDDARPRPGAPKARAEYGLPEDAFVFCCFNNPYKITPREFDIWMRLLAKVDDSVLWLMRDNPWSEANLRAEAQRRGIDPGRLVFAERARNEDHVDRHGAADLFLDTFIYNAHTTASDALWAGLPLVTMAGRHFAARVGASLLRAVGLPELVTESVEDYETLALELAKDRDALGNFKQRLASARETAPLFDTARFARHLERAYDHVFDRHLRQLPPADLDVQD